MTTVSFIMRKNYLFFLPTYPHTHTHTHPHTHTNLHPTQGEREREGKRDLHIYTKKEEHSNFTGRRHSLAIVCDLSSLK
jgi:hypothetical protein